MLQYITFYFGSACRYISKSDEDNGMQSTLKVEFSVNTGENEFKEESVAIHNTEELFAFVAPGGDCDSIPDEVQEIQILFLPPAHRNLKNPLSDHPSVLQLGGVIFNGPLSEIVQTASQMLDKAERNELSASFLTMLGAPQS